MLTVALIFVPVIFLCILAATLIYVGVRGESAERWCIIAITIGSLATGIAANRGPVWYSAETGIFMVDVATLIAFIVIMARSTRFWPLWITALQIIAVMTHLARFLKPQTVPMAYAVAEQLWVYIMIVILIVSVRQQRSQNAFAKSVGS
ncbi:hypothetical protein [Sphingomonas sp. Leaf37]|uniref:hypothetical protein n=1 Tax=Sphingomonas sp. Leaf37 TaxID=2876552 RepID=UPI001E5176DC|nr:hypothetical protein [Sphingomonas sp. Leaf37]